MKISKEFTAIIDGVHKISCVEYKGKLFTTKEVGVGQLLTTKIKVHRNLYRTEEYYARYEKKIKGPVFSKGIIDLLGATERVEKAIEIAEKNQEWTDELIDSVSDCIYALGINANGILIVDGSAEKERIAKETDQKHKAQLQAIWDSRTISTQNGYFGLKLKNELPDDVWQQIKKYGQYWSQYKIDTFFDYAGIFHDGSEKGWYYKGEIVEILTSMGWTVYNEGKVVANIESLNRALNERHKI